MKQWCGFAVLIALAVGSQAGVFERHLSADRPADRAIMAYLELEKRGKATSTDLAELAVLLVNKGFPNDAEDYLRAALKLDKHNHEAMFRLGLVLQCQGRNAAACTGAPSENAAAMVRPASCWRWPRSGPAEPVRRSGITCAPTGTHPISPTPRRTLSCSTHAFRPRHCLRTIGTPSTARPITSIPSTPEPSGR